MGRTAGILAGLMTLAAAGAALGATAAPVRPPRVPVILFTDFSADSNPEDWLDLALALRSDLGTAPATQPAPAGPTPLAAIDLRAVVLEVGTALDTPSAVLVKQVCARLGASVPRIVVGTSRDQIAATRLNENPRDELAQLLRDFAEWPSEERITIVCTGRLTNLAEFIRRDPKLVASRVERIYVAAGYLNTRNFEYFAELDPGAWVATVRSGMPIVLVPRDVAGMFIRRPFPASDVVEDLMAIKRDETLPAWVSTLPVWMLVAARNEPGTWGSSLQVRPCRFTVTYAGLTAESDFDSDRPTMQVVTAVDARTALGFLSQALVGARRPAP